MPSFLHPRIQRTKTDRTPPESQIGAVFCFLLNVLLVSPSLQGSSPAAPSADNKLVRTTRVRRQTSAGGQAPPLSSENQTAREQPLVFNHVYNINVPLESLCSVELDSAASPGPNDGQFNWSLTSNAKQYKSRKAEAFLFWKGSRAGLGSSPPMEGPADLSGPTEFTEQMLDADSQVGILFRSASFWFLPQLKLKIFFWISRWRSPTASTSRRLHAVVRRQPPSSTWSPGWKCWRERFPCSEPSVGRGAATRDQPWVSKPSTAPKKNIPIWSAPSPHCAEKYTGFKKGLMPKRIQTDRSRILMPRGNNVAPLAAVLVVIQEALPGLWRLKWTMIHTFRCSLTNSVSGVRGGFSPLVLTWVRTSRRGRPWLGMH